MRAGERAGLQAEGRPAQPEGVAIGADAEKGDALRPIAPDLGDEAAPAGDEFGRRELVGARRGAIDEVGDAVAIAQEQPLFGGVELARREAGGVQRRPEAVSRAREVMSGGAGVEARIDAAEKYLQAGRDDVAQPAIARPRELRGARPG